MDLAVVFGCAFVALGVVLVLLLRSHSAQVAQLKREIESVEVHNRQVENENRRLQAEGASLAARLKEREEAHARLEEACAALEQRLSRLTAEKDDLERRTRGFQGEWDRQMTTLEEEIQTVVRQLGEFRRGTKLPLPPESEPPR
jgi:septal ring factor EnvC (AmiA/AmiB activator)